MAETTRRVILGLALGVGMATDKERLAWDFTFSSIDEGILDFARFRGRVLLVVNTASFCGYTSNVRLEQFDQPDVFLVHAWEGKPLTRAHGGPVRMLVPRVYLWKSAKWLRRIQFTIRDLPGFWEVRGYHNTGDPWTEERYS